MITDKRTVFFISTYDNSISFLNHFISSNNVSDNYLIKPISKMNNNIAAILIHNKYTSQHKKIHTSSCNSPGCKTCKHVNNNII